MTGADVGGWESGDPLRKRPRSDDSAWPRNVKWDVNRLRRFNKIAFSGWPRKGTWVQASEGVAFGPFGRVIVHPLDDRNPL